MKKLLLAMLFVSCSCGGSEPTYEIGIDMEDPLPYAYGVQIATELPWAYQKIRDCQQPDIAGRIDGLTSIKIEIAKGTRCRKTDKKFCACVNSAIPGTIFIVDGQHWSDGRCKWEKVLCHELIHVAGFYGGHAEPFGQIEDECCKGRIHEKN